MSGRVWRIVLTLLAIFAPAQCVRAQGITEAQGTAIINLLDAIEFIMDPVNVGYMGQHVKGIYDAAGRTEQALGVYGYDEFGKPITYGHLEKMIDYFIGGKANAVAAADVLKTRLSTIQQALDAIKPCLVDEDHASKDWLDEIEEEMQTVRLHADRFFGDVETGYRLSDVIDLLQSISENTGIEGVLYQQLQAMNLTLGLIQTSDANLAQIRTSVGQIKTGVDSLNTTLTKVSNSLFDEAHNKEWLDEIQLAAQQMQLHMDRYFGSVETGPTAQQIYDALYGVPGHEGIRADLEVVADSMAPIGDWLELIRGDTETTVSNTYTMVAQLDQILAALSDDDVEMDPVIGGLNHEALDGNTLFQPGDRPVDQVLTDEAGTADDLIDNPFTLDLEQSSTPPVWTFQLNLTEWLAGSGWLGLRNYTLQVDWSFWAPFRTLAWAIMITFVTLNSASMVWEEVRKYG